MCIRDRRYTERIDEAHWPEALREGVAQYHSVQAYVAHLFDSSIFADPARFEAFLKTPSREQLLSDPMMQFKMCIRDRIGEERFAVLHHA